MPDSVIDVAALLSDYVSQSRVVCWLKISAAGEVVAHNAALEATLGRDASSLRGAALRTLVTDGDAKTLQDMLDSGPCASRDRRLFNFLNKHGEPCTLAMFIEVQSDGMLMVGEPVVEDEAALRNELIALNNRMAVLVRENERKTKALTAANQKLEETTKELQNSYWHIRKIQEVLPICMQCGKVKTETSKWEDVADFLKQHSLFLSHGYCPVCVGEVLASFRKQRDETSSQ